jgi:hypothetical protein
MPSARGGAKAVAKNGSCKIRKLTYLMEKNDAEASGSAARGSSQALQGRRCSLERLLSRRATSPCRCLARLPGRLLVFCSLWLLIIQFEKKHLISYSQQVL